MGQLVQLTAASDDVAKLFKANAARMIKAAPKGFDPQRLLSIAFNAIAYNTDLLQCTRESLIGGAFEAVKLGLTLGGPMQEAWLIPFNSQNGKVATFIVGYQGYRNLIDRARSTLDLHPRAVHNGMIAGPIGGDKRPKDFTAGIPDEWDYWYGDEPRILHKPRNAQPEWKEQLQAVYVVARLRGGGKQLEVLLLDEIEAHRNRSRAKSSGPWVTDYVPMALKTAVRKISKYLPKASLELARALDLDNRADAGDSQDFEIESMVIPPADPTTGDKATAPRGLEGLKTQMGLSGKTEAAAKLAPLAAEDINFGS